MSASPDRAAADRAVRIGVVPFLDGQGGGIYQYSVTMLEALLELEPRPELVLFADRRSRPGAEAWRDRGYEIASIWPQTAAWRLRNVAIRLGHSGPAGGVAAWLGVHGRRTGADPAAVPAIGALGKWIARYRVDFLLFASPSLIGVQAGVPFAMAVHDLQHRLHPEFPEVAAAGEWEWRERLFRNGIGHALAVLVDSEVGREDVLSCYGDVITADRVRVLPFLPAAYLDSAGAATRVPSVRDRFGLPERYLFFPAQFWPHKNHVRVVDAVARLRAERGVDVTVAMCGSAGDPLRASVLAAVRRAAVERGVEDLIRILGYVEDDLMAPLYAGSRGVLLPTFLGPTNIPVVEAWAMGVPVLTSDVRGIREQCGDAALLVDPLAVDSIARGIHSLWADDRLRARLVAAGTRRLASYGKAGYAARLAAIVADADRRARQQAIPRADAPAASAVSGPTPAAASPNVAAVAAAPAVSVVIPARDRQETIAAAIESVRGQTFADLEIIVVDDGSTDRTVEIASAIAAREPRLRVLAHPHGRGAQAARNTGIRAARGEWVAFLDSDDVYYPESLAVRLAAARETGLEVVHSACDAVGPDGPVPFPIPPVEGDVYRALLTAPAPMFQGLLVKRGLLHRIGLLSESVPSYQEWDTSIRLAATARFGFVPQATFIYDLRTRGAISRDGRRAADGYEHVVSRHWLEVVRVAGPRVVAGHYRIAAGLRVRAGDRGGALRCALVAQLAWPFSPRRTLRTLRLIARGAADPAFDGRLGSKI
jgi:glycosyltransferase involved in cell wall biosynthesis